MGYLILAFCSSALVSIVMRLSDSKTTGGLGMLAVNYAMCTVIAALETKGSLFPAVPGLETALGLGVINGIFYLTGFVLMCISVGKNGVVLSSTFMKLGLLVTTVISILFFGEMPTAIQAVGFVLAVGAIVMIRAKGEGKERFGWLLPVLMVCGGLCDGMSKVFEELGSSTLSGHFLFYTFAVALILCSAMAAYKKELPGKWELLFGILIGIPNYYSSRFLLWSLRTVPGVIAYPVYSVAGILVVTVTGVLLFREKLQKRQWAALGVILAALVLLNI